MPKADALMQIKWRRQQMAARKPLPNGGKRTTKWLHPVPVERQYQRELEKYVEALAAVMASTLLPHLQSLIDQRNLFIPEGARADDWADDALKLAETTSVGFAKVNVTVPGTAAEYAAKTNVWNDTQWRKVLHQAVGVDVHQREPWLGETLNSWTKENVALITKMGDDYTSQVEGMVQRGVRSGQSVQNLTKDIQERTGVTKSRARLIARDQVSKLNGQLTELRQTNIGIKSYIWNTSGDERVRARHKANDGKTFSWNKPPPFTGHPGWDYQCRCWAEPIFDEIIEEIKTEENKELGWVLKGERPPGTVIKEYGSKASAQSMKSKVYKGAELKYNSVTGKWELHITPTTPVAPVAPIVPAPQAPVTLTISETKYGEYGSLASAQSTKSKKGLKNVIIRHNPSTNKWEIWQAGGKPAGFAIPSPPPPVTPIPPPQSFQGYTTKTYASKASAQSMKSKVYKNATIQFNSVTGKWELRIPTGPTPMVKTAAPIKPKAEVPGAEVVELKDGIPVSKKGFYVSDVGAEKELAEASQVTNRIPQQALNRVADYERKYKTLDYESGMTFDAKTGERLFEISQHAESSVRLEGDIYHSLRNNIMTHNHPNSTSFSDADLANVLSGATNPLQKRACSDLYTHVIERNENYNDWWTGARHAQKKSVTSESVKKEYEVIRKEKHAFWHREYVHGNVNESVAFENEIHDVNIEMAKRYNYHYARFKNTEDAMESWRIWEKRSAVDPEAIRGKIRTY